MSTNDILCVLIVLIVSLSSYRCMETPKAVMILSRHGDRTPVAGYPNDPYREFQWPGGYGALSAKGIEQSCTSGEVKSHRYSSLIRKQKVYIKSSVSGRCMLSAESFLNGFLPLSLRSHINIDVTPASEDEIFVLPGKKCPRYSNSLLAALVLNQTKITQILQRNETVLDYIRYHSGLNVTSLIDILNVYDALAVQDRYGFDIPAWARSIQQTYLKPLVNFAFTEMTRSQLMQIKSGLFLKEIIQRFEQGKYDVLVYMAHDLTLSALMELLGVYNQTQVIPDFASSFVMELHKNRAVHRDYEIRLLYFKDSNDEIPIKLEMPACPSPCPLKMFKIKVSSKLISDYDTICN